MPAGTRLLPAALLQLPVAHLDLPTALGERLAERQLLTVGDLLELPARAFAGDGWLTEDDTDSVQRALLCKLREGPTAWDPAAAPTTYDDVTAGLFGGLADDEQKLVRDLIGVDGPPVPRLQAARRRSLSAHALDDRAEQARARLHQSAAGLLGRLRAEVARDLSAGAGVLAPHAAAAGSLLRVLAAGSADPLLGARLLAFCFPREFALHREHLCACSPRSLRRLVRELPRLVPSHRLPLPVATLEADLAAADLSLPRGLLVHLLRLELRMEVAPDGSGAPAVVPDPRSPSTRLVDLLLDLGRPTQLDELVYAYRERFRRTSRARTEQRLRRNPAFVLLGPSLWSLRRWHLEELEAVAPLADRVARRVAAAGERQRVAALLADDRVDERQVHLVLDLLAADPRVRLLGRGEVCATSHRRSHVLEQLLVDFRRAAGDVVASLFVQNQPPARRRLVARLLRWNRLFVVPAPDRIDVLANYPFNKQRMRRLLNLVGHHLDQHGGQATVADVKAMLDGTDLGGGWLSPLLLADLLRRHGPFELLADQVVCRRSLQLGSSLLRTVRHALRAAGTPLTVDEILLARPELSTFASCLHDLIVGDPLLQTRDGAHFTLV